MRGEKSSSLCNARSSTRRMPRSRCRSGAFRTRADELRSGQRPLHLVAKHPRAKERQSNAEHAALQALAVANHGHLDRRAAGRTRIESIVPPAARPPGIRVESVDRHGASGGVPAVSLTLPGATGDRASFSDLSPAWSLIVDFEMGGVDIWPELRPAWPEVGQRGERGGGRQGGLSLEMDGGHRLTSWCGSGDAPFRC